jgi:putative endonuclease
MFYIYIIYSESADKHYIGHSNDPDRRLVEHNSPSRCDKYPSKYLPWELKLFFKVSGSRGDAIIIEKFIKNQKSRAFLEKLIAEKNNQDYFNELINNVLERKQLVRAIPSPRD